MCTIVGFEQLFIVTCRYVWTFNAWSKGLQINLFKAQTIIRLRAMKVIYCIVMYTCFEQLFIVTRRYVWTFNAWLKRLQNDLFKAQTVIRLGAMKVTYC